MDMADDLQGHGRRTERGSRCTTWSPGRLMTASRNGMDVRGLVWRTAAGRLSAWNASNSEPITDTSACAAGFVVPEPADNPGLVQDCETLLGLRDELARHVTLYWGTKSRIADWEGVTIGGTPQRVHELRLSRRGLTGSLPPELGRLTELRVLSLGSGEYERKWTPWNGFYGAIPAEWGELRKLEVLDLNWNYLSGEIPAELGQLTSLRILNLSGNFLIGSVPAELGTLTQLKTLKSWSQSVEWQDSD